VTAPRGRVGVAVLLLAAGCARPPVQPPAAPARDVVVLAPDPESGALGRAIVSNAQGRVELAARYESTTIAAGRPPAPPSVMSEADVQRLFGPALVMQPPPARRFNLYFESGTDMLTPESKGLVAEVIVAVQGRVAPDVSVIGHTDTTGTAAFNVTLGLQRAALIRDLLVQAGLPADLVEVVSHGESDPLVPTPDNTAEARNRRVEVTVR
jgi:outer membrane protein OmpA-like peptidoglycan-associated protein